MTLDALITQTAARFRDLLGCQSGVSAVEFSLMTPFLVVGGLSTFDAGMAAYEKMMMTQVLRAGAHSAIAADSQAEMLTMLQATAADNFTLAQGAPQAGELAVGVASYCICPEATATQVACTDTCTGGASPSEFYALSATMEFDGVMLPNFTLDGTIDVMAQ